MKKISGKKVSGGVLHGQIMFYEREQVSGHGKKNASVKEELASFETACKQVREQLQNCYIQVKNISDDEAKIFLSHQMFLEDIEYLESIRYKIEQEQKNAREAISIREQELVAFFLSKEDELLKARVSDIQDVSKQLTDVLMDYEVEQFAFAEPTIMVVKELLPSEMVRLSGKQVGIITQNITPFSHTAILAKTMGIPMMNVEEELSHDLESKYALLDGNLAVLYIEPEKEYISQVKETYRKPNTQKTELKDVRICANITDPCQVKEVLESQADGIGLFRSEMIYLKQDSFPTEEEQFSIYKAVLENMNGKRVVIRTLDVGGDKQADYMQLPKTSGKAKDLRGVRFSLSRPDIFRTQLRALLRAGAYGKLAILFPMVSTLEEIKKVREILEDVKEELEEQQITFCSNPELGVMIETPEAVSLSRELVREVDFASIGTNDLTRYILEEQNRAMGDDYDQNNSIVLDMVQVVIENTHAEGKKVSICGEIAGDESMFETLISLGVDELSMPAYKVKNIK